MRRGLQHIARPAADYLFADKLEVESIEQLAEERPVFLILAQPRSLLCRRFVLQPVEILVAFLLFLSLWKLLIVLHELLEMRAVDKNRFCDVDRF